MLLTLEERNDSDYIKGFVQNNVPDFSKNVSIKDVD